MKGVFRSICAKTAVLALALVCPLSGAAESWEDVADRVLPAVVKVEPVDATGKVANRAANGSGFLIDEKGYVVTALHVLSKVAKARIWFHGGDWVESEKILRDTDTDLALVQVEESVVAEVTPLAWADSRTVRVGERVMVLGAPFGYESTVTRGIISATHRSLGLNSYEEYLQTDAAVNPGNSGGPLVNRQGQVLGVITAIKTSSGDNSGVSFAVSSRLARYAVEQMIAHGKVNRGHLGTKLRAGTREEIRKLGIPGALLVTEVVGSGSPAARAGLKAGDWIVKFHGEPVRSLTGMRGILGSVAPGTAVALEVVRSGERVPLEIVVGERTHQTPEPPVVALSRLQVKASACSPATSERWGHKSGIVPDTGCVVLTEVPMSSAAYRAGLRAGDLIMEAESETVTSPEDLQEVLDRRESDVLLRIVPPAGKARYLLVTLVRGNS